MLLMKDLDFSDDDISYDTYSNSTYISGIWSIEACRESLYSPIWSFDTCSGSSNNNTSIWSLDTCIDSLYSSIWGTDACSESSCSSIWSITYFECDWEFDKESDFVFVFV
jgi:hypothetical protein